MQRRHVKRREAFLLKFAMLHHRIVAEHEFSNRVGEVDALLQTNVTLDQRQPAVLLCNNEIAWK